MDLTKNKVSAIIVTYNSRPSLPDCLKSLRQAASGHKFELIVVDNGSDDGSLDVVKEHFPDAILIEPGKNLGFARACNLGAVKASGEYLLFHNPDLMLDPDALERLLRVYEYFTDVGAVAGRMRYPDGRFQPTCRKFPTVRNMVFSRGSVFSRFFQSDSVYTLPDYAETTEVDAVAGTLLMVRAELFRLLGGFDQRFFMYMEDTDLCLRLSQAGYHNYFEPSAGGVHLWGKGSRAGDFKRSRYHHMSVWKYFMTHSPNTFAVFVLPILLLLNLLMKLALSMKQNESGVHDVD